MAHKALARKYRPRSFADVATQQHASETLKRAVAGDRVGHAYLFCGPRGVGKTTLARVLAMALNCPDRTTEGEPCGVCESCGRIWGGHTALDVVEIDAASNRGVEDARDLRERAMYAPSGEGRYKVYIVDEAHMLTREAWNALLKILEEPPPRVIFVFATTEPHKIQQSAAPILSRCQRFDFRRIGISDIVAQLQKVLREEGTAASEDALRLIARKADGGMRDALSLLDQVLSLTGGEVDSESVRRVLGLVEEERYLELVDVLGGNRPEQVLALVQTLVDEGYDLVEFYHGLLDVLRALLRLRLAPDAVVELPEGVRARLAEQALGFEAADIVRMLAATAELESQGSLRRSPDPRILIEMLLLRLSYLDRTVSIQELIEALGGAPAAAGGAGGGALRRSENPTGPPASESAREPPPGSSLEGPSHEVGPVGVGTSAAAVSSDSAPEAWRRWLEGGVGIPRGMTAFLRSALVRDGPDGSTVIAPLEGPAVDRLAEASIQEQISRGLEPYLGRTVKLVVEVPSDRAAVAARVTEREVREDTLRALYRQEPRLRRAVEELDLELME